VIIVKSYDPAAGVVVLKFKDGDWNVLFLKTRRGKYDLTKGIIEQHETPFNAAVRETFEEAGIDVLDLDFRFGKIPVETDRCTMYVAVTTQEPEIKANRIGIDTGAYYTDILTCLVIAGDKTYFLKT